MKWTIHTIEFTCGATLVIKTCTDENDPELKETLAFLPTRRCPQCQFEEGNVTPLELAILMDNDLDQYLSSIRDEETDAS